MASSKILRVGIGSPSHPWTSTVDGGYREDRYPRPVDLEAMRLGSGYPITGRVPLLVLTSRGSLTTKGLNRLRILGGFQMRSNTSKAKTTNTTTDEQDMATSPEVPEAAGTSWMVGEDKPSKTTDIGVVVPRYFSDSDLSEVDSWETAMSFMEGALGDIANAGDVLGTGFRVATEDDKLRLCGVPLALMQWAFYDGDFGEFVAITAIQRHDNGSISKWIINDGGTGIRAQLKGYTQKTGRAGGLGVPKGLVVSNFYFDDETGTVLTKAEVAEYITAGKKPKPAHTFYLNTSA